MNKIKKLFKGRPIAMVIAGVLVAGVASAAILAVYTTMVGEGDVQQSVVFGNGETEKSYTIGESPAIAGNTYTQNYNLMNRSETTAPIKFVTNQCMVGGGHCPDENYDEPGVETSYWSTVELENKNTSTWHVIPADGTEGILTYELAASTFNYEFEASGLTPKIEYSLIYYADKQNRFKNWGGDNPGALIATAVADDDGKISIEGSKNLAMNLPHADDWNGTSEANYCNYANDFDDFDLCRGAKVWLVPSSDYNAGTKSVDWSNAGQYLYETDLITYDDTANDGVALYLGTGKLNFFVKNELAIDLAPGTYQVKTKVMPVPVQ